MLTWGCKPGAPPVWLGATPCREAWAGSAAGAWRVLWWAGPPAQGWCATVTRWLVPLFWTTSDRYSYAGALVPATWNADVPC